MSLSCAIPQQADACIVIDGEDTPPIVDVPATFDEETSATSALVMLSQALERLAAPVGPDGRQHRERQVSVPANVLAQMSLVLFDYRRTLEALGAQMQALPTAQERDCALTAYQSVCQHVVAVLSTIDCLVKGMP